MEEGFRGQTLFGGSLGTDRACRSGGTFARRGGATAWWSGSIAPWQPEGAGHPWPCPSEPRRIAQRRPSVFGPLQRPTAGGEERLPEPQSGQGAGQRGNVSQARRMTNLCPENPDAVHFENAGYASGEAENVIGPCQRGSRVP